MCTTSFNISEIYTLSIVKVCCVTILRQYTAEFDVGRSSYNSNKLTNQM